MFNNLLSSAIKAVKGFLGGSKPVTKAPAAPAKNYAIPLIKIQKFAPIAKIPALSVRPIANWGESSASVRAREAVWSNSAAKKAQDAWQAADTKRQQDAAEAAAKKKAQAAFDKTKADYKARAEQSIAQYKTGQSKSFWSKVTGGFSGESSTRTFADDQLRSIQQQQTVRYDTKLNDFLKWQTKYHSTLEKKKFTTQKEYDEYLKLAKEEESRIADLEYTRAANAGLAEAYGSAAEAPGSTPIARIGGWFNKNVVHGLPGNVLGGVWQYTLGAGSKTAPSLVTAPSRLLTAGSNLFRKKGDTIYDKSGNATKYNGDAWGTSFEQSNLNGHYAATSFDTFARNKYKEMATPKQTATDQYFGKSKWSQPKISYDQWIKKNESALKKQWDESEKRAKGSYNLSNEWALDPLSYLGWGGKALTAASSENKFSAAASKIVQSSSTGRKLFSTAKKIANSKAVTWAKSEHMDYAKRRAEFIRQEVEDIKRKKPLVAADVELWQKTKHQIKSGVKQKSFDTAMQTIGQLEDPTQNALLRRLGRNNRAAVFQELLRNGNDWSKIKSAHKFSPSEQKRFSDIAKTVRKNLDDYRDKELAQGIATPFRQNYIPQYRKNFSITSLLTPNKKGKGDGWWFEKRQDGEIIQSHKDLVKSLAAREYYSKLSRQDLPVLARFRRGHEDIGRNIERIENVNKYVKRTKWEQAMRPFAASTRIWKKAVLAGRPAWAVNNELYNTQAAVLAGGGRSLIEKGKLLRPKNWQKAKEDLPEKVWTDLTGELGSPRGYVGKNPFKKVDAKLTNFYTRQENWSRVAAFQALIKKGFTADEAMHRLDKYFFKYSTKNIERPLKAVMPFYSWNKGLTKAAVNMPFDRPLAAKSYNEVDRYQRDQFDRDFESVVPDLTALGYSEDEIQEIKKQQEKYFKGRLKVGGQYINTPFNAFSEKGLTGLGFNPYLSALGESSASVDSFNSKIRGRDAALWNRILTKFPQIDLTRKSIAAARVASGQEKPSAGWIGEAGSEGYGLTKERQGYDTSKKNYDRSMDPRAKLGQDFAAFFGVPRGMKFDAADLVKRKALNKATEAYFSLDTKHMEYQDAEKARQEIFKKYGLTAEEFYDGILSKYDTDNTTRIKNLKKEAADLNKKLFAEYAAQPKGKRNVWATQKLRELNSAGYFDKNPFLKSFGWINPETVANADKQVLVDEAVKTGDWSKYRDKFGATQKQKDYEYASSTGDWSKWHAKYGFKSEKARLYQEAKASGDWSTYEKQFGRSAKALARDQAVKTGDWTAYAKEYGVSKKTTPYKFDGKYFKSAASMKKYQSGKFWHQYASASKDERRQLLEQHPEFNTRGAWTADQWTAWKTEQKQKERKKLMTSKSFRKNYADNLVSNHRDALKWSTLDTRDSRFSLKFR